MDGLVVTLRDPTGRWLAGRPRSRGCGPCPLRECRWWGRRGGQFALAEGLGAGLVVRDEPAVGGALVAQPEHGEGLGFLARGPEKAPAAGPGALDDGDVAEHAAVADEHLGVGPVLAGVGEDALGDGILGRLVRARSCTFGHGVSLPGVEDASRVRRVPPDRVGLALARAVVASLAPDGAAVTVAVDDTLFHRYGRKVHGAKYQHDGSARGRDGIGRGNCFVIVGVVAAVPFLARQVCLPVLFRLHIPKTGASKTEQARAMVDLLARPCPGAPSTWWRRPASADRPGAACPPASPSPPAWPPTRSCTDPNPAHRQARTPRLEGPTAGHRRRRGRHHHLDPHPGDPLPADRGRGHGGGHLPVVGSLHRTPIRVVLVRGTSQARPYTLAPATTDLTSTGEQIVARYASRWSSNSRSRTARTSWAPATPKAGCPPPSSAPPPLGRANLTILVLWYDQAGQPAADLGSRRRAAPWYRHKRHVSTEDMIIAFRRARVTGNTAAQDTPALFDAPASTSQAAAA